MNREILFRARRVDNGEWVEGYYVKLNNKAYIAKIKRLQNDEEVLIYVEVIPETVGQYTGLTDKNGKKIFEGDYCRLTKCGVLAYGIIKSCEACFWFVENTKSKEKSMIALHQLKANNFEVQVIGNIHDNPELLEG